MRFCPSGRKRVSANCVTEGDEVAIGGEHQQFALAVGLIDGPVGVGFGERIEFRLQFGVETVDVMDIEVVGKAPISCRGAVRTSLLENAKGDRFAMDIGVVGGAKACFRILKCW
jgi:hypothetical protein